MDDRWTEPLILASASPRRRWLLEQVGIPIEVDPAEIDEDLSPYPRAEEAVTGLARRKAEEVGRRRSGRWVLAADTLVHLDGESLGKPSSRPQAEAMLRRLSGRWHEVFTGVALLGPGGRIETDVSLTRVRMNDLGETEIDRYLSGPEPYDKAGAYALQGRGGWLVAELHGSSTNVMGLPLEIVRRLLAAAGLPLPDLDGSGHIPG